MAEQVCSYANFAIPRSSLLGEGASPRRNGVLQPSLEPIRSAVTSGDQLNRFSGSLLWEDED